jgi:hypothetical protein
MICLILYFLLFVVLQELMCTINSQLCACQYCNDQNYFGTNRMDKKWKLNPPPQMQVRIIRDETVQSICENEFPSDILNKRKITVQTVSVITFVYDQ